MKTDNEQMPIEVMWSPARLAAFIGVNLMTIYRWIREGQIRDYRKIGRAVRIPQSEVQRLMNAQKEKIITKTSGKNK